MKTNILTILEEISSDTKRKFKEKILQDNASNSTLSKVFWAAYNPEITYWIAAHPHIQKHIGSLSLDTAIDEIIANVASRKITGNAAINFYQDILSSLTEDDAQVLRLIIDRDLRCGVQTPTINKIWKGLIPTYEIMLAGSDQSRLQFPDVVVQPKFDGIRCLVTHKENGEIEMRTRNGNLITCLEPLYEDFRRVIHPGETWDGELVCYNDKGIPLSRKISNGITYKAIRGTINEKEVKLIRFAPWDIVDKTQTIPYEKRLQSLYLALSNNTKDSKIIKIPTYKVQTLEDVEKLFEEALSADEEGVIAKNLNSVWEPKRSVNLVKFKAEKTADLVVVGWEEGSGKYKNMMGSLICETSDGEIRVNVGSGFSDEQRKYITENNSIDKIVEIMYNARITKKDGGTDSLYLPRFIGFRIDKLNANNSKEIK